MIDKLKDTIAGCYNDVVFTYNGKKSGVTSEVHDSVPTFQVWHGDDTKVYSKVDDVINDRFYSGKSLKDIADRVEFEFL